LFLVFKREGKILSALEQAVPLSARRGREELGNSLPEGRKKRVDLGSVFLWLLCPNLLNS
jgi:hypothetical protein